MTIFIAPLPQCVKSVNIFMRYHEFSNPTINESMLQEAFLNDLARMVGNKAKEKVAIVNNTMTAAQVLYKVCSNQSYLESMTFELKRAIKQRLRQLPDGKLKQAISGKFPAGRGLRDFFTALALVSVLNTVAASKNMIRDQALDTIVNNVVNLDALIGHLLSAGSGALGAVLKALGVGNTILFSILTDLNKKIQSMPAAEPVRAQQPTS